MTPSDWSPVQTQSRQDKDQKLNLLTHPVKNPSGHRATAREIQHSLAAQ
jgi:hypothetical protein